MDAIFYISAVVAVVSSLMVVTRAHPVHALLYLVVSLFAIALIFYVMGAPFAAALEVIIYAGAILVLFAFVVMMLNLGGHTVHEERLWLIASGWIGPGLLATALLVEVIYVIAVGLPRPHGSDVVLPEQVGVRLFSTYLLATELASFLLLSGLITAYHLSRRDAPSRNKEKPV